MVLAIPPNIVNSSGKNPRVIAPETNRSTTNVRTSKKFEVDLSTEIENTLANNLAIKSTKKNSTVCKMHGTIKADIKSAQ